MSLDFLVPIVTYPDPTSKAGLGRAIDMVASITGRLSVLAHEVEIPPVDNALAEALVKVSALAADAERRSRDAAGEITAETEYLAHRMMLPVAAATFRAGPNQALDRIVDAARLHDATVFVFDPASETQSELAEAILFGSGGPVILCPADDRGGHLQRVMVAWDGSRASSRALRDAMPVLRMAQTVTLATADEDKSIAPSQLGGIRALLEYHGIQAAYRNIRLDGRAIGEALQSAAMEAEAGLLVMGAYGHSRFREFMLGGATASVLRDGPLLPIFLSH